MGIFLHKGPLLRKLVMNNLALETILMLALPLVVFVSGAWIMARLSHRQCVVDQLNRSGVRKNDRNPLKQRLGYDIEAVQRHWGALDAVALGSERTFLQLDLIFPFFYGAALMASLMMAWSTLGRPFRPVWIIAPVVFTMLADWTENLVQLSQLRRYLKGGEVTLQAGWIQIASTATILKFLLFTGSLLSI
jgi:hypothetical protein